jgi:hypothetical protein
MELSSQDCRHWMLCREASLFIGLGLLSSTSCSIAFLMDVKSLVCEHILPKYHVNLFTYIKRIRSLG